MRYTICPGCSTTSYSELATNVVASSKKEKKDDWREGMMKKSRLSNQAKLRKLNVEVWLTRPDKSALFNKQSGYLPVNDETRNSTTITVNPYKGYQTKDFFGLSLTAVGAFLVRYLPQ